MRQPSACRLRRPPSLRLTRARGADAGLHAGHRRGGTYAGAAAGGGDRAGAVAKVSLGLTPASAGPRCGRDPVDGPVDHGRDETRGRRPSPSEPPGCAPSSQREPNRPPPATPWSRARAHSWFRRTRSPAGRNGDRYEPAPRSSSPSPSRCSNTRVPRHRLSASIAYQFRYPGRCRPKVSLIASAPRRTHVLRLSRPRGDRRAL